MISPMHALIIEDESLIQMMIEYYLADLGYTSFQHAETQAEAVDRARLKLPDLITADLRLADGNGRDAVRLICADRQIPVVLIAGDTTGLEEGDYAILAKPFTFDGLQVAVAQAVSRVRQLRPVQQVGGSVPLR